MKKKLVCIMISMLLFATIISVAGTENYKDDITDLNKTRDIDWWANFRHDTAHTGNSSSDAPDSTGNIKFITSVGKKIFSSPVVDNDLIYFGSCDPDNNKFYCLNTANGDEEWSYSLPYQPIYKLTVFGAAKVAEGYVYFAPTDYTTGGKLYCFDANPFDDGIDEGMDDGGALYDKVWEYPIGGMYNAPTVLDGKVYAGSHGNQKVFCFNASNGDLIWSSPVIGPVESSPAVVDGYIYVGAGFNVYCLDANDNGSVVWSFETGHYVYSAPSVVDGKVYVGSNDNKVYCLDAVGNGDGTTTELWNHTTGNDVFSSPAIAYGKVYVGSADFNVYCLNADNGSIVWSFLTGHKVLSSPAVADGKIYVGSDDNKIYCLDAEGNGDGTTTEIWSYTMSGDVQASPAVANGSLYVAVESTGNNVYRFDSEINNPPNPPEKPNGPTFGFRYITYNFTTSTIDPNGHQIYYQWDWGDGEVTGWIGPYNSSETVTGSHEWELWGSRAVKVRAKDIYQSESNWSNYAYIHINIFPSQPKKPTGETMLFPGIEYTYTSWTTDVDGDDIFYQFQWGDGNVSDWYGPYPSGDEVSASYQWMDAGIYNIRVLSKDIHEEESRLSDPLRAYVSNPPEIPSIPDGPIDGEAGRLYTFETSTTDPDDDNVKYMFDWGDDTELEWTDYYSSGATANDKHRWTDPGYYAIRVKATDSVHETDWSSIHIIHIVDPSEHLKIAHITGGVNQVKAVIENNGDGEAEDVNWEITVKGGILSRINVNKSGTIDEIEPDSEVLVETSNTISGLGLVDITVTVNNLEKEAVGLVIGKFVFVLGFTIV